MRRSLLLMLSLLVSAPALAGGGGAPAAGSAPQFARPLWTARVDPGSGIEGGGYFGVYAIQNRYLVGLDHRTGRVKWRSATADRAGTPLLQWPNLVASHLGGSVAAYDALTGKERWSIGGGNGPVRLADGPSTGASSSAVLALGQQIGLALGDLTGNLLWRVDAVSGEHTVSAVPTSSGPTLILHSPSEGVLGNVYTAHDPGTGRELWRLRAGQGYLLGEESDHLVFDLRAWPNLLGEGGTVRAARVNKETGRREELTLRVGVPNVREWWTGPGTLKLDGAGGTWALAVRVRGEGAVRLIHTPARGQPRFWTLPGRETQMGGAGLRLTSRGALAGLPDGHVVLIDPERGTRRTVLPPGGGVPTISERWGGARAIVRADQTVFLDDDERIRLRIPGRVDDWTTGGDLQTVIVRRGQALSAYAWPGAR